MSAGRAVGSRYPAKTVDPLVSACDSPLAFPVIFQWFFPNYCLTSHPPAALLIVALNKEHTNPPTHNTKAIHFSYEAR